MLFYFDYDMISFIFNKEIIFVMQFIGVEIKILG